MYCILPEDGTTTLATYRRTSVDLGLEDNLAMKIAHVLLCGWKHTINIINVYNYWFP